MNLILTEICNKRCSFCFTPLVRKSDGSEMSLQTVARLLDRFPGARFQLLGGEPTEHSRFAEVLQLFAARAQPASLVSNLLFDGDKLDIVIERIGLFWDQWILANAMELDVGDRREVWARNFMALRERGYECKPAITITRANIDTIVDYAKELYRQVQYRYLRIGIDLYGNAAWVIRNRDIGEVYAALDAYGKEQGFGYTSDCQVPYCINARRQSWHSVTRCQSAPLDVFADGSACYCYPLKHTIRLEDVHAHGSAAELSGWFADRYLELFFERAGRQGYPEACHGCAYYLCGECCICLGALQDKEA